MDRISAIIQAVIMRVGVPELAVEAMPEEIAAQATENQTVSFEAALQAALESFISDGTDYDSPLAVLMSDPQTFGLEADQEVAVYQAHLRKLINQPGNSIELVRRDERFQPERGESLSDYWVFRLKLPNDFPFLHWALVRRDGSAAAYNYGFN